MSSTKFTPGPWTLLSPKRFGGALGDAGDFAIVAHSNEIVAEAFERDTTGQSLPSAANAHLIVSAPGMYETLESTRATLRRIADTLLIEGREEISTSANAAIREINEILKKARGE